MTMIGEELKYFETKTNKDDFDEIQIDWKAKIYSKS